MTDDEKLLSAWADVPTEKIRDSVPYVRGAEPSIKRFDARHPKPTISDAARRRVVELRKGV